MDLLPKISPFLSSHIKPGDKVVIALSGGLDSVTLCYLLKEWAPQHKVSLVAAHLNHGLRGREAKDDADSVKKLAKSWGINCYLSSEDVSSVARKKKITIQEAARLCRYAFLEEVAQKEKARWIALGHNADDQVETFLLNLMRGGGSRGLRGMEPVSRVKIIRPLWHIWRSEIETFAQEKRLAHRHDSSNRSTKYFRNKVRLELLPLLEKKYSHGIKKVLWRTAANLREEEQILDDITRKTYLLALQEKNPKSGALNLTPLQKLPVPLRKRVLVEAYRELKGDTQGLSSRHWDSMERLAFGSSSGKKIKLPGGIFLTKEFARLVFYREEEKAAYQAKVINCPGETKAPAWGIKLKAEVRPVEDCDIAKAGDYYALFDYERITAPLTLRPWISGDRFCPLGMKGEKKLQDFFTDLKVPRSRRSKIPILSAGERIAWVVGYRIDERLKVRPVTKKVLTVEVRPL